MWGIHQSAAASLWLCGDLFPGRGGGGGTVVGVFRLFLAPVWSDTRGQLDFMALHKEPSFNFIPFFAKETVFLLEESVTVVPLSKICHICSQIQVTAASKEGEKNMPGLAEVRNSPGLTVMREKKKSKKTSLHSWIVAHIPVDAQMPR